MSVKQDRAAPRNAADLERKYNFGKSFSEAMNLAESAKRKADEALDATSKLTQDVDIAYTSAMRDSEKIMLEVVQGYTKESDFEAYKDEVAEDLKDNADSVTNKYNDLQSEIGKVNSDLQEKFNLILKYFTFDVNGLTIGQVNNPYKVVIDNDRYSMFVNGVEMLWFDGDGKGHIPELGVTRSFDLFGYHIYQDESGNVNCQYVED